MTTRIGFPLEVPDFRAPRGMSFAGFLALYCLLGLLMSGVGMGVVLGIVYLLERVA